MHGYALGIAAGEGITGRQLQLLQAAAILHDVGINEAKRRFATVTPKLQEEQGAILAGRFLRQLNWDEDLIAEICFLVGNHHSYEVDGGPLLQIIFEADYLVNYQERLQREGVQQNQPSPEEIQKRFRTESGRRLFATMHP
ncbi:MAG: HD domain-containing protein [Symbiobacteriaceae bacterium]|nr:HD domain-containing protein [Symbiobacteriaceae bacterium]